MAEGVLMFVRLDDPPDVRLETVGRPVCPDDEIMLLDEDDNIVPFGEVGEFCCRGPYTLRGYYGAPEHNARVFTPDGFYRSGDLMRQHPSGNYMVEGRKKDLINRGGEKISAEEIENLILSHESVQNVACVPVPDPELGERMCACIVLQARPHVLLRRSDRLPGNQGDGEDQTCPNGCSSSTICRSPISARCRRRTLSSRNSAATRSERP